MSLDMSSGRRTDLLFPIRNNGHGPSASISPSLFSSASTSASPSIPPTPFSTSESASSLVSTSTDSSSVYPASSLYSSAALSPSSSSNSIGDAAYASSSAVDVDSSAITDSSSLFSSPPPLPPLREFDLSRRSSGRPLPLSLKTANTTNQPARTSSLSTLPNIATVTTTVSGGNGINNIINNNSNNNERRSHSLASNAAAQATSSTAASFSPAASARTSTASVAPVLPIRRKPLASSLSANTVYSVNSVSLPAIVDQDQDRAVASSSSSSRPASPSPVHRAESKLDFDLDLDLERDTHSESDQAHDLLDQYDQYSQYDDDDDNNNNEQDSQDHQRHSQAQAHPDQHQYAFDLENALDIDIDDFLPRPDQRFTRSGSVDSPTLYEFPKTPALFAATGASASASASSAAPAALTPPSLSKSSLHSPSSSLSSSSEKTVEEVVVENAEHEQVVEDDDIVEHEIIKEHDVVEDEILSESDKESVKEDDKESFTVALDSQTTEFRESLQSFVEIQELDAQSDSESAASAGTVPSRNSVATTPAAPETGPTTVSSQHEQDLTTTITTVTLGSSDQILTQEAHEDLQEPESPVKEEASHNITQRNSTMSLFTRKTSPPHLSLGSISNTNPNNNHTTPNDNKEDNAQRSVSPDDNNRNSLYSVYDDEELQDKNIPIALPTISTSIVNVNNTNINNSNSSPKNGSSETITTIVTANLANDADSPNTLKPNNKSPSSAFKLGNFFGWPSASPSTTDFSDQSYSPLPSPSSLQPPPSTTFTHASTLSTPGTNSPSQQQDGFANYGSTHTNSNNKNRNLLGIISPAKTNTITTGDESSAYYEDYLQTPPIITPGARTTASPSSPLSPHSLAQQQQQFGQIEEMEDELKAISAELAASIRREMDLEDLVDRLQTEVNNPQPTGSKRTSDYFSDSGAISSKFGDYDAAKEEIAQVQRRAEQEKAQIRLELTDKLTDERSRRRVLDQQIKDLSERASGLDLDVRNNSDATGRVKQLESTCEDLRRRLSEERGVKENFEDLLAAMKTELQNASNERDNLRDEVVPQLRARVEGLESQATEHARQIYETTKMQQELQSLKDENSGLRSAAAYSAEASAPPSAGLSRSNTVKGMPSAPPSNSANTSNSTTESREALAERLKDVEAQRDALHSALKSLLERQEFQNRENDKKIRVLELERQRLLTASPKKAGYERDVAGLRDEVGVLRRRAEEALEQKWQVEKGLSGLKMDLDRAEEEIAHLRTLLQQHDIFLPSSDSSRSASNTSSVYDTDGTAATSFGSLRSAPVTSASLETAYKNLQKSYADALDRIRALKSSSGAPGSVIPSDEKTTMALQRLERSLSSTMAERDAARDEVASHLTRLADSAGFEKTMLENERSLAEQLDASARRVEELAQQVRTQLETNSKLRDRLTQMVARGEADQQTHKNRITGLESRLRALEDQLVATQTAAEDRVARHEEQVAALKEAHNTQLQRLRDASGGIRASSPNRSPVTSPRMLSSSQFGGLGSLGSLGGTIMSPMFSVNGKLVPPPAGGSSSRPSSRGSIMSGGGASASGTTAAAAALAEEQQAQVATLKARVGELETALSSADSEMQDVVGRMNTAQIEVMQLQEELETAGRETRRLQRLLETEKVKGFEERFKMLSRTTTV